MKKKLENENEILHENNPIINSIPNLGIPIRSENLIQKPLYNIKAKAEFTKLFPPFALGEKGCNSKTTSSEYGSFIYGNNKK